MFMCVKNYYEFFYGFYSMKLCSAYGFLNLNANDNMRLQSALIFDTKIYTLSLVLVSM